MSIPIVMFKASSLQKTALPLGAIGKTIGSVAAKGWANPLARRAAIGAGIGGTGNLMFGDQDKDSAGKRLFTGAVAGGIAGSAYHGATRLGMPSVTATAKKMTGAVKNPAAGKSMPTVLRPGTVKMKQGPDGIWTQ